MLVTDAPPQRDVKEINVRLSNIQVGKNSIDENAGFVTVGSEESTLDLIQLRDTSLAAVLGEARLVTGNYTQIRMDIEIIDALIDGQKVDVDIDLPGAKLKLVSFFEIRNNQTTTITIDFDMDDSLVFTGSDKVIFKPVVKLVVVYD